MYRIVYNDELYHHGILGQKWGHRNGPPYPLGASDHSAAEKAAMSGHGSSSKSGSESSSKSSSSSGSGSKASLKDRMSEAKRIVNQTSEGWSDLDYSQQRAIIELGAMAAFYAYIGISVKVHTASEQKRLDTKLNDMYEERDIKTLASAPKLKTPMSAAESMKVVNPGYPKTDGTTSNCMLCSTAMAMREKGYNVKANKIDEGLFEKNINKAFEGPDSDFKKLRAHSVDQIYEKLAKEGDGAYGNLTVEFYFGGGHSVFWKVENGQTHIYDGQSGKEYKLKDKNKSTSIMPYIQPGACQYARLDNAEPTEFVLGMVTSM